MGSKLYEEVYKHYLEHEKCYELIVEDANDNFQRVQDLVNSKYLLKHQPDLHQALNKESFISTVDQLEKVCNLVKQPEQAFQKLCAQLKLPPSVVQRLIDLLIFSKLEMITVNPKIHHVYRLMIKRRLYIRCMKIYPELFKGRREVLQARRDQKLATENKENDQITENQKVGPVQAKFFAAYMWNSSIKDDEFGIQSLKILKEEQNQGKLSQTSGQSGQIKTNGDQLPGADGPMGDLLTQEGIKIQLKDMYEDMIGDFKKIKERIKEATS